MVEGDNTVVPLPRRLRCSICGKPPAQRWRPFCSKRCADVDLGRWLGEAYRIPGSAEADDEPDVDAEPGAPPDNRD